MHTCFRIPSKYQEYDAFLRKRCHLCEYLNAVAGDTMIDNEKPRMSESFGAVLRNSSAFVPPAMSLAALALLGAAYIFGLATGQGGLVREPDEGSIAHLWQLLMAGQLPVLAFFAIKWLPRAPKQALCVLALQVAAVLAAMAPIYLLNL